MYRYFIIFAFSLNVFAFSLNSLLTYTFPDKSYDMKKAKQIYFDKKCNQCHGPKGMQMTFATNKPIAKMEPAFIKSALVNYANNLQENGRYSAVMYIYASNLTSEDMNYIIAYLKGPDFALDIRKKQIQKEEKEENTSSSGTFLE